MKKVLLKIWFYVVIVPLSWLPTNRTLKYYRNWREKIWPEHSAAVLSYRTETIKMMLSIGFGVQSRGSQIWAFKFPSREILLADHPDLKKRWAKAYSTAYRLQQMKFQKSSE
jgi:hypothetical protein